MSGKLLLHHCCAPCSPEVVRALEREYSLVSFWYNPNIHPKDEHEKRRESLERFVAAHGLPLESSPECSPEEWTARAAASGSDRCAFCYRLRLAETARRAVRLEIPRFSTTLLASPYQKHDLIVRIGAEVAAENGLSFCAVDTRPRYFAGKDESRRQGYYLQKYCGCSFSREEREKAKAARGAAR